MLSVWHCLGAAPLQRLGFVKFDETVFAGAIDFNVVIALGGHSRLQGFVLFAGSGLRTQIVTKCEMSCDVRIASGERVNLVTARVTAFAEVASAGNTKPAQKGDGHSLIASDSMGMIDRPQSSLPIE